MGKVDISGLIAIQLDRQLREQVELNTALGRQAVWALDHDPIVRDADVVMADTDQGQVWRHVWMVINRVCTQVKDMMKGQSNHQVNDLLYSQVSDNYSIDKWIEYKVDTQVMGPLRREMSSQVWDKLEKQLRSQVIEQVDRQVDRRVYRQVIGGRI